MCFAKRVRNDSVLQNTGNVFGCLYEEYLVKKTDRKKRNSGKQWETVENSGKQWNT